MKTIFVDAVYGLIDPGKGLFQEMYELLEGYPNPKIILTGANKEQREKFGLIDLPYDLFTLEHDPEKTDPEYYKILLRHYDLKPEEVIYFEHDQAAVNSASSVGIQSYFYDSEIKDLGKLRKFIDEKL
jgi:HAD superfamily hydrolase (TIGR01509 family)